MEILIASTPALGDVNPMSSPTSLTPSLGPRRHDLSALGRSGSIADPGVGHNVPRTKTHVFGRI